MYKDPTQPWEVRRDCMKIAAPYERPALSAVAVRDLTDTAPPPPPMLSVADITAMARKPAPAGDKRGRDDSHERGGGCGLCRRLIAAAGRWSAAYSHFRSLQVACKADTTCCASSRVNSLLPERSGRSPCMTAKRNSWWRTRLIVTS